MKNIASPLHRFVAAAIDGSIYITLSLLLIVRITSASLVSVLLDNVVIAVLVLLFWNIILGIAKAVLTASLGGSIGKLVTGIEVVDPDNKHLTMSRSFFRNYIGTLVAGSPMYIGYLWIIIDKQLHRGWNDLVTDSFVVIKHKAGLVVGLLIMIILLGLNVFLINTILSNVRGNSEFYQEMGSDISSEIKKSFEPTPTPQVPSSDKILPVNNSIY